MVWNINEWEVSKEILQLMDGLDSIKHENGKMLIKILCLNKNRKSE